MNPRLLEWVFENLGLVIVLTITALSFLRGMFRAGKTGEPEQRQPRSRMTGEQDPEAAERTRKIQEEIRRKIAERQGDRAARMEEAREAAQARAETARAEPPPLLPPSRVPPVDPFGGSMRKILRKIEEAAEQRRESVEEALEPMESAALRRQRELEEQLRAVEAQRAEARRRAQEVSAREIGAGEAMKNVWARAGVSVAGVSVRDELRDPRALRRAFVLREVLGPPVGLK